MADPSLYIDQYRSPLEGFENAEPLPDELNEDGKSYKNPTTSKLSPSYQSFTDGLVNGRRGGFDVHIYYFPSNRFQVKYAKELWERIRREFSELRIYKIWDKAIGPHTLPMFEVNLFTPAQFGAFIPWLAINRGPLSVLIHPNTENEGEAERNHTQRAIWMGQPIPIDQTIFKTQIPH